MATGDVGRLLRWYPPAWRDRYGEEFVLYMQDSFGSEEPPLKARLSIVVGGLGERARRSGLTGDSVPPTDRIRAGVLIVLVAWTTMIIAGASFAKMSEHFDSALGNGTAAHHLPDLAYTLIQTVAGVAGLVGVAAAGVALPAFVRYLRSGGWPSMRAHVLRAAGFTLLTAGVTAPLFIWAHHLTAHQRNGGSTAYSALFLAWAALIVITLVLWTVLGVAAARKVTLSRSVLAVEAGTAVAVALAVVAILGLTCLWWAVTAEGAPTFISGDSGSPLSARLVATVALMALAAAAATAGAMRITRSLPEWRHN
jgi:hypothetical protein